MQIAIAGAGLSGAVIARTLAEAGHDVVVYETRDHVAGNCHTARDSETGVMVHVYGPHIFHTDDQEVIDYVTSFAAFRPYRHQVRTISGGRVFSMPITLLTINQFFGKTMGPDEARAFVADRCTEVETPITFEEQALSMMGPELYEAFFKGYTEKQWGQSASDLPASILKRLPMRFTYDDSYFNHGFQAIPENGYTALVEAILDHARIDVRLKTSLSPAAKADVDHVFWTGPLDAYFDHALGHLGYRTLDFERIVERGDHQGCPVMNYADRDVPWTRITEHKHFAPWETHEQTVLYRERSREAGPDDIPYYPIRLVEEKAMLADYEARALATSGVTFAGRLATYRYIDMDVTIREALDVSRGFLKAVQAGKRPPIFSAAPLG